MQETIDLRRRHIIAGSAAAAAGLVGYRPASLAAVADKARALPEYAAWKDSEGLIVHSTNTIETIRGELGTSVITPGDKLFVRNNLAPPDASIAADPDAWTVTMEGVRNPRSLSVRELRSLGVESVAMTLQCSGNGRGFFGHKASGTQWTVGAAGCVIWSGVPVAAVAERLGGPAAGMHFMTGTGGEKLPDGIDPRTVIVERSLPLAAMKHALLAWELNGEPIPLAHGGPLRLIVPGYYGINNVKYIRRLAFTSRQTDAAIQASGYRVRPIGQKGQPDQPSMWEMNVKSWIDRPAGREPVPAGLVQISGVAFAGTRAVRRVDVTADGGRTWRQARFFGPDLGPYAWRQFVLPVTLNPGSHALASRATDIAGSTQPAQRVENERGYANNSWLDHAVKVSVV